MNNRFLPTLLLTLVTITGFSMGNPVFMHLNEIDQ